MNSQRIVKSISSSFPTKRHNTTRFGVNQILMVITLASISGISRICRISTFSGDGLVRALLKLDKAIKENAISATTKNLRQSGAHKLQILLLSINARWLRKRGFESITLDADSTFKSVCCKQEGAEKGFNTTKKGARSYYPLLVFVSKIKLLYHTWFRSGSAYTAIGIVEFIKGVQSSFPQNISKEFFRADGGFFSGGFFDLLDSFSRDYFVKMKLENLEDLLKTQDCTDVADAKYIIICEFSYRAKSWQRSRTLKAIQSVKEYFEVSYLGENKTVSFHQYVCYARVMTWMP